MVAMDFGNLTFSSVFVFLAFGMLSSFLGGFTEKHNNKKTFHLFSHIFLILSGVGGLISSFTVLFFHKYIVLSLWNITPDVTLRFGMDSLSALFVLIISGISIAVCIYSIGYIKEYENKKNVGLLGSGLTLFLLSMIMVVTVDNILSFLFAWELMSLISFLLVMFEHEKSEVRHAGYIYIVMTHFGTIFIFLVFLILFLVSGSMDFYAFHRIAQQLPHGLKDLLFVMTLIGFGTKAGIVPLHVWLPRAHPAAPSHVSALMSAVMIKTAIYGFLRVVFDFLGGGPAWWGLIVLCFGIVSALTGIFYGLADNDIKRFLAYSSAENIGIIFMGIGASLLFYTYHHPVLCALAMTAALYHVINHAIFKGLLFLSAGAVVYATHTKNMNQLGGLIHRMPWTAGMFLLGGMALSALPPFNGFISEWATFQSLLHLAFDLNSFWWKFVGGLSVAALGMTGAFVAGGIVKNFGTIFLAIPRTLHVEHAREVPLSMRIGMTILAGLALLFGVWPGLGLQLVGSVTEQLFSQKMSGQAIFYIPFGGGNVESISLAGTLGASVAILFVCIFVLNLWVGKGKKAYGETWNCGNAISAKMEYTGTSFSHPVLVIFQQMYRPKRFIDIRGEYKYYPKRIRYRMHVSATIEAVLYKPVIVLTVFIAKQVRNIQNGNLQIYLAYMIVTLIFLLLWAR